MAIRGKSHSRSRTGSALRGTCVLTTTVCVLLFGAMPAAIADEGDGLARQSDPSDHPDLDRRPDDSAVSNALPGYSVEWNGSTLEGWLGNTTATRVELRMGGGNAGGYLRSDGDVAGSFDIGCLTYDPRATGDFRNHVWRVSLDIRFDRGNFDNAWVRFRYRNGSENGWVRQLTTDFVTGSWRTFSFVFDPTWTDGEARAAGWLTDREAVSPTAIPSEPFEVTMSDVYTTEVRISGTGYLEASIDNFRLGSVGGMTDTDGDGIPDDGDNSGSSTDRPCVTGQTTNCDDNCPANPNPDQIDRDADGFGAACEANLRIVRVEPIQSVFDSDLEDDAVIDLVTGKRTAVSVRVDVEDGARLDASEAIPISIRDGGTVVGEKLAKRAEIDAGQVFVAVTSPASGGHAYEAYVDPENVIEERVDGDNHATAPSAAARPTYSPRLSFADIQDCAPRVCFDEPAAESSASLRSRGAAFLRGALPLSESQVTFVDLPSIRGSLIPLAGGIVKDLERLSKEAVRRDPKVNYAVGVASKENRFAGDCGTSSRGYFPYHLGFDRSAAVSNPGVPAAIVAELHPTGIAHELGHYLGLPLGGGEEYRTRADGSCCLYYGNSESGYWAELDLPRPDAICLMGSAPCVTDDSWSQNIRWIERQDYEHLFGILDGVSTSVVQHAAGEERLLISGHFSENGGSSLQPWYAMTGGLVDLERPGEGMIRLLDASGAGVIERAFPFSFQLNSGDTEPIPLDVAPFVLNVAFPENARRAQVLRSGVVLADVDIAAKLLHDAVDLLPEACFGRSTGAAPLAGTTPQAALHAAIDRLCRQPEDPGPCSIAPDADWDSLIAQLESRIPETCASADPLEISKSEILDLAERLKSRW